MEFVVGWDDDDVVCYVIKLVVVFVCVYRCCPLLVLVLVFSSFVLEQVVH